MDPVTEGLALAAALVAFGSKVWDAMPKELQTQNAGDWGKFTHNIGSFVTSLQDKINAAAAVK